MTELKYQIKIRLKDRSILFFESKEGTFEETKELFENIVLQFEESDDFIKCPQSIIMKSAIAYIGISKNQPEEDETEVGEEGEEEE